VYLDLDLDSSHVYVDTLGHVPTPFFFVEGRCLCLLPGESKSLYILLDCLSSLPLADLDLSTIPEPSSTVLSSLGGWFKAGNHLPTGRGRHHVKIFLLGKSGCQRRPSPNEQEQSETAYLRQAESDPDPESVSESILRIRMTPKFNGDFHVTRYICDKIFINIRSVGFT